jgi:peptidoglycan/xylan/chitin deacetylase (PgdA/CDA1 family)
MRLRFVVVLLFALAIVPIAQSSAQTLSGGRRPDSLWVPILVYHSVRPDAPGRTAEQRAVSVTPETFRAQMRVLRDSGYRVVSFEALVAALQGGASLPPRAVVITFDDGLRNQVDYAAPILREFGFVATFFVYSSPISRIDRFMTWEQVRALRAAGHSIGSHTQTHPYLTRVADSVTLRRELVASRERIVREVGVPVTLFAYPFGVESAAVRAAVRAAGYVAARRYGGSQWQHPTCLDALGAVPVSESMTAFRRALGPR